MELITIFTPTYNRVNKLDRLYNSLVCQSNHDFVWMIVDDGSTDNTKEYVKMLIAEKKIKIKYIYQENQGKHVAHNNSVSHTETELFFCVDSDDYLTKDAVEIIKQEWNTINSEDKDRICGIVAYRGSNESTILGTPFPDKVVFDKLGELYKKGKIGDTALIFRSSIIKQYPFPSFKGEKFLRESVLYHEIDKNYNYKILRKIIYVCEYYSDGLTKNAWYHDMRSPKGAALYRHKEYVNSKKLRVRVKNLLMCEYFCVKSKSSEFGIELLGKKTFKALKVTVWPMKLIIKIREILL